MPIRYIEYGTEVVLLDVTGIEPLEALALGREVRREVNMDKKRFRMVRGTLEAPKNPIAVADPAGSLDPPEPTVREAARALWDGPIPGSMTRVAQLGRAIQNATQSSA